MHRFFVPPEILVSDTVHLPPEIARQAASVLRLRTGEQVILLDNLGTEYLVELISVDSRACRGRIIHQDPAGGEPLLPVTLYLALSQREKYEWALQKCTEIGISSFVPLITSRSLVQNEQSVTTKADRWRKIIREAAEQSGRGRIPALLAPLDLASALSQASANQMTMLFAWEKEKVTHINQVTLSEGGVGIIIGPEGGFSDDEARLAMDCGAIAVSLGRRILRMETAAIVASALVLHYLER